MDDSRAADGGVKAAMIDEGNMRRLRDQVATSLDGYIAGPKGEFDWIIMDPDIDFTELFMQFDTAVMGRKTFLSALQQGGDGSMPGLNVIVFSRTLSPSDYKSGIVALEYTVSR
jgi:dihydrofolate reductase